MDLSNLSNNLLVQQDDGACNHLTNFKIPTISLPNQDGNLLKLNRIDTFRLVLYCYPMTGRPDKPLPNNWHSIPGAKGCTLQTCSFRDNYDKFINLNSIPIGVSTQTIDDLKEMVKRLRINYDVLSDINLELLTKLKLPWFKVDDKVFLKRVTLIIEKSTIKKFFYPIFSLNKHINQVLEWLKKNQ